MTIHDLLLLFQKRIAQTGKTKAEISSNESIQPINGWNISNQNKTLSKEFVNCISYYLPVVDFAQNASEILIDIQKATNISLQYGFLNSHNMQSLVSSGKISISNTSSANSISIQLSGHSNSSLKGKSYTYTNLKNGYHPASITEWITSKLKDVSDFSIVFQSFIKDVGWSKVVFDGQENPVPSNNSIYAFRLNFVSQTEKQYLIDFWNRDTGTTHT